MSASKLLNKMQIITHKKVENGMKEVKNEYQLQPDFKNNF